MRRGGEGYTSVDGRRFPDLSTAIRIPATYRNHFLVFNCTGFAQYIAAIGKPQIARNNTGRPTADSLTCDRVNNCDLVMQPPANKSAIGGDICQTQLLRKGYTCLI